MTVDKIRTIYFTNKNPTIFLQSAHAKPKMSQPILGVSECIKTTTKHFKKIKVFITLERMRNIPNSQKIPLEEGQKSF